MQELTAGALLDAEEEIEGWCGHLIQANSHRKHGIRVPGTDASGPARARLPRGENPASPPTFCVEQVLNFRPTGLIEAVHPRREGYSGSDVWRSMLSSIKAALCSGPSVITIPQALAEFGKRFVLDLRDAALVNAEFACNFAIAPVEIEEERNDLLLSRRKALPGALNVHPVREGRRGAARAPGLKRRKLF